MHYYGYVDTFDQSDSILRGTEMNFLKSIPADLILEGPN